MTSHRGQPRRAAAAPAVPGRQGPLGQAQRAQQRRDLRQHRPHHPQGRRVVRRAPAPRRARAPRSSPWAATSATPASSRCRSACSSARSSTRSAAASPAARRFKAAQLGGPSGGCIPKQHLNMPVDYESLQELGAIMGSGGLVVMDEDTCMVDMARFFLEFTQDESCGKCPPCRVGTKRMLEIVDAHLRRRGRRGRHRAPAGARRDRSSRPRSAASARRRPTRCCRRSATSATSTKPTSATSTARPASARPCSRRAAPTPAPPTSTSRASSAWSARSASTRPSSCTASATRWPRICGRVCFHPCESKCQRAGLDAPVAIRGVKRFMTEQETDIAAARGRRGRRRERRPQGRRDRLRPGRPVVRLLPGPPRLQADRLRGRSRPPAACSCRPSRPTACRARSSAARSR